MAAHSVTILNEMFQEFIRNPEREGLVEKYLHALDYAPGMDELDLGRWIELRETLVDDCDSKTRAAMVFSIVAIQYEKWIDLGEPSCHEDWMKVKEVKDA